MEIFKDIKDYEGLYEISNYGNIRSYKTKRVLKGSHVGKTNKRNRIPYKYHGLFKQGKRKFYLTHRLVAEAFIDNPKKLSQINHINKNVQDNRVENLEWISNKENTRHAHKSKILQLKDGVIVKEWQGLYEIGDAGFNKPHISTSIKNKTLAYGYKWKRL